jgi:hypothetical protein
MRKNPNLRDITMTEIVQLFKNSIRLVKKVKPITSLITTQNNDWVLWTEDGFFDASKNGAKYIGYHINQGVDKEAKFISSDQVHTEFYRPDIVKKALSKEDVSKFIKQINIKKIIKGGFAPEVSFLTKRKKTKKCDIEMHLQICDTGGGVGDVILVLNGTKIRVEQKSRQIVQSKNSGHKCFQNTALLSLQPGKNTLKLIAYNKKGTIESDPDKMMIFNTNSQIEEPNLYVMLIAINNYKDEIYKLKYAVEDAKAIKNSIKNVSKKLFKKIKFIEIYDENVTQKKLDEKFSKLGKVITSNDVFIVFMAGHGATDIDEGRYHFLPYDFISEDINSVKKQGISDEKLKDMFFKIPAQKSLVLMDTCNSGAFVNQTSDSQELIGKMAMNKLARLTGRNYITASSGDQVALEGYEGHGVFTYTILDAFSGKGFVRGKLTVLDLAKYVEEILPELSYKKWGYRQIPLKNLTGSDFPIGME